MQNPIRRLREELQLSQPEFAALLDVSPATLWLAEHGARRNPVQVFEALKRLGYDVQAEYEAWRAQQQAKARERLRRSYAKMS